MADEELGKGIGRVTRRSRAATGYLVNETDELRLRNAIRATRGIARFIEGEWDERRYLPEIPSEELAAILFTLADINDTVLDRAEFKTFKSTSN